MISYRLKGTLVAETPIHLGNGEGNDTVDAAIARDHDDQGVLPGTSLAGILGDVAARETPAGKDDSAYQYLFGKEPGQGAAAQRESNLWVFDAPVTGDEAVFVQAHTALDPTTGAVSEHRLYSEEHAVKGTAYGFYLRLDVDDEANPTQKLAMALLLRVIEHLEDGAVRVGGKSAAGRGRVKLTLESSRAFDWSRAWDEEGYEGDPLPEGWREQWRSAGGGITQRRLLRVVFEAKLRFPTPLFIQEPLPVEPMDADAAEPPSLPDVLGQVEWTTDSGGERCRYYDGTNYRYGDQRESAYAPGSTFRGALRNRLMQQVRTLHPDEPWLAWDVSEEGKPKDGHPPKADAVPDGALSRSKWSEHVCLVSRLFGYSALGGTIFVDDVALSGARHKGLMHNAVDRFHRSPVDGKLFSNLVVWPDDEYRATLRIELLDPSQYDVGVVTLLLKDIHRGHIRVGHGKSAGQGRLGLGRVTVTYYTCEATAAGNTPSPARVGSYTKCAGVIDPPDPATKPSWVSRESGWLKSLSDSAEKVRTEAKAWADAACKKEVAADAGESV